MKKLKAFLLLSVMFMVSLCSATDIKSTTTVIDPQGNVTTQTFFGAYPYITKEYLGSSTLLNTTTVCYNGASFPCTETAVTEPLTSKQVYVEVSGIASPYEVNVTYDGVYGLVTDSKKYDYGPTLVNESVTAYATLSNANIRNRPSSITYKGHAGATIGKNVYTYNGNGDTLTKASLVTGSTYLTSSYTYTSKGVMATSTGVDGSVTTYSHDNCGSILPHTITHPVTGAETFTWNCNGGVVTSATDVNGKSVTTQYNDPYWRPTLRTDALGTAIKNTYKAKTFETSFSFDNSTNSHLITTNGAGRPIVNQTRQSAGSGQFDTVSVSYDNLGRTVNSSMPCIQSASAPCPTSQLSMSYDIGSVPTTVASEGLGGVLTTTFQKGDIATILSPAPSGEVTKGKQMEYDGLGRLTSVCEISSGAGSGSCGQRVARTGFVTSYTYDDMGNMLTVTQGAQTRTFTYDDLGRPLTITTPESGTDTYTYDSTASCGGISAPSQLVKSVDAAGNTTCYSYDSVSRLISKTYSGPNATDSAYFVYDSATVDGHVMQNTIGRLAEAYTCTSCPGTKKTDVGFSYNAVGQITDSYQSTTNSGGYYHIALTLYANQAIKSLHMVPSVIPDITYGLDGQGRPSTAFAGTAALVSSTPRGSGAEVLSRTYGSGDKDVYGYDTLLRMTQYSLQGGVNSLSGTINYNANSSVASSQISDPVGANTQSCTYTYDAVLRLSTSNCGAVNQSFGYDRYGNIQKTGTFVFTPTYSSTTNRMTAIGVVTPTYDAVGNLLTDGTNTYTWDAEGNMLSVTGVDSILYNALGQQAEMTIGSAHQQTVYLPSGKKLALMSGQSLNLARVPLPGGAQAVYNGSGLQYYAHVGTMGSSSFTTTPSGAVVSNFSYAPFGEPYNNAGVPTSTLSFTGSNQDTKSGLYDSATRKYNPTQSRWVSADKANSNYNTADPQSFNLYSYVNNRPFDFVDPSGNNTCVQGEGDIIAECVDSKITYTEGDGSSSDGSSEGIYNLSSQDFNGGDIAIDPLGQAVLSNPVFSETDYTVEGLFYLEAGSMLLAGGTAIGVGAGVTTAANTWLLTSGLPAAAALGCAELCSGMSAGTASSAAAEEIPSNPLFHQIPGPGGWTLAEELPSVEQFGGALGHSSKVFPTMKTLVDEVHPQLNASSFYFEGRNGMWRYSDHTFFDVRPFMTEAQILEHGGKMAQDKNGIIWVFKKPITTFKTWEDYFKK